MSTQTHLEALKAKHRSLEAQLAEALAHASSSDMEIARLKHQKLTMKNAIAKVEAEIRSAAFA